MQESADILLCKEQNIRTFFPKKLLPCLMQSSVKFYRMFPDEGSCDITVTTWSKYSCVFTRNLEKLFPTAAIWKGKTLWNSAASYQHLKPVLLCIRKRVVKLFPRWMEDWMRRSRLECSWIGISRRRYIILPLFMRRDLLFWLNIDW